MAITPIGETELDRLKRKRDEMLSQLKECEDQIQLREREKRQEVVESVRELVGHWGLTQDEIFPSGKVKVKAAKGVPKYQHPENPSLTWSGRGPKPKWVKEWIASGRPVSDFEIRDAQ